MDLGLGNLTTLKTHLLAASLAAKSSAVAPDAVIAKIGSGLALQLGKFCGRAWPRVTGAQQEFTADRLSYIVPNYPIEQVSLIETRATLADPWLSVPVASVVTTIDYPAGIVVLAWMQGIHWTRVRVTWDGGYWYETKEPADSGYPTAQPAGSTALPDDLQLAWLLWCQEVWNKRDKLGIGISTAPDQFVAIGKLIIPEGVKEMVRPYRRMQLL